MTRTKKYISAEYSSCHVMHTDAARIKRSFTAWGLQYVIYVLTSRNFCVCHWHLLFYYRYFGIVTRSQNATSIILTSWWRHEIIPCIGHWPCNNWSFHHVMSWMLITAPTIRGLYGFLFIEFSRDTMARRLAQLFLTRLITEQILIFWETMLPNK